MAEEIKRTDAKAADKKPASKKPGLFTRLKSFCRETKSEVSKVVWPTPKQVLNNTLIVLGMVILSAVFIGLVDFVFKDLLVSNLLQKVIAG